jgi:Zn-dependent M28 family amino/carboxypeptidase
MKILTTSLSLSLLTFIILLSITSCTAAGQGKEFDGNQALKDVEYQVSLGPRIPGSKAHDQVVSWIGNQLKEAGWESEVQTTTNLTSSPIQNIVAKRGNQGPWIILGAHYDSRLVADHDPDTSKRNIPVPGANDGASGVAVLLELARSLPKNLPVRLWLVFFDAEDNGNLPGWDWILGSRAFVNELPGKPDAAVILDMIGDANLNIPIERNSDAQIVSEIWKKAQALGYSQYFIPKFGYAMIDDHTPFLNAGIPAADIIDFDYPYYHTTQDTPDKVSAESLGIVGKTIYAWLTEK